MHSILGCVQTFFNGFCCGSSIEEIEDPERFTRYFEVLHQECALCLDSFKKTDFIARTIIGTECLHHFHKQCLDKNVQGKIIPCPMCRASFDRGDTSKNWNRYLERVNKQVLTELGMRDNEVAQEIALQELEEREKARRQVEDDAKLAILLSRQD
mgnify:CR=1 FL=1